MRILSTILSLYFLALSVVPCADYGDSEAQDFQQELISNHDHSDHDHPAGEDLCTPFCVCQCCHTSVVHMAQPKIATVSTPQISFTQHYFGRLLDACPSQLLQPPQV